MTPEEVAKLNSQMPGFAAMAPQQQQLILNRLRGNTNQPAPEQPSTTSQVVNAGLPFAAYAGAKYATNGGLNSILGNSSNVATPTGFSGKVVELPAETARTPFSNFELKPGGIGGYAGAAYGGYNAFNALTNNNLSPYDRAKEARQQVENAGAAYLTGGVSTLLQGADQLLLGGKLEKFRDKYEKILNPGSNLVDKGVSSLISGKSKDQRRRDADRKTLQKGGILDDQYNLTLSDGSKVNLGLDGSIKNYNVDFTEEGIGDIVALVNPFAYLITGGDPKRASDLNGQITNAIKNAKNPQAEMEAIFSKAGLYKEDALNRIDALNVDDQTKAVFANTVKGLNIPDNPQAQMSVPTGGTGGFKFSLNIPKTRPADPRGPIRDAILQNMLQQNTQPIQYPMQNPNYKNQNFSGTLQKLVGI